MTMVPEPVVGGYPVGIEQTPAGRFRVRMTDRYHGRLVAAVAGAADTEGAGLLDLRVRSDHPTLRAAQAVRNTMLRFVRDYERAGDHTIAAGAHRAPAGRTAGVPGGLIGDTPQMRRNGAQGAFLGDTATGSGSGAVSPSALSEHLPHDNERRAL